MSFFLRLSNTLSSSPLILSLVRHKHCSINSGTPHFLRLLNLCKTCEDLRPLTSLLIVQGLVKDVFLVEQFVWSCFHLGSSHLALSLFQRIQRPSLGLQNLVIRYLSNHGLYHELLYVYLHSGASGCPSDDFTFPFVIKACAALAAIRTGEEVHGVVIRTGFEQNLVIQTALVDFYAKTGCMGMARPSD